MEAKPYSTYEIGPFGELGYDKLFLKDKLGLTSMEISVNRWPPGTEPERSHRHYNNEEIYIILQGEGEIIVEDQAIPVKEGSVVRIPPHSARRHRNNSNGDLVALVLQAHENSLVTWTMTDGYFV